MNPLDKNDNCEFAKFFKNLGYEYSWDYDRKGHWHELYKDGKLILQVEMVPLKQIVDDMCVIEEIEVDYFLGGGSEASVPLYKELCDRVREYVKKNPL